MTIVYLLVTALGFISLFISTYVLNSKLHLLSLEKLIYCYILSMSFFLIFSKLFYIILQLDFSFINIISIDDKLRFIFSGYSFMGGYVGIILSSYICSKITSTNFQKLLFINMISIILMYSILKIGCFINGCCASRYLNFFQIYESIISLGIYIYLILNFNSKNINSVLGKGIAYFSMMRFITFI